MRTTSYALGLFLTALGCSSQHVMTWDQSDSGGLVHCFIDGSRVKDRREVEKVIGAPCRTETDDGPPELYLEAFYCASPQNDGWAVSTCAPGCSEYRWAYVGVTPVSCSPAQD